MANAIEALLSRISDSDLRAAIKYEIERLKNSKDFGLVFERHLPESVRLSDYPISRGSQVQERSTTSGPTWFVDKISGGSAFLVNKATGEPHELPLAELVALKGFGEVVYPGFKRQGGVHRGEQKTSNLLISGENYYVLQSLLYAFEEKVDVIYIDPPYNTGARDWKYNNDYVDAEDAYRHSKWLAFMERRLLLARRLLNPEESVLIVTIDEKEFLRLGLILEQTFPEARIRMVSTVVNPSGSARANDFSRVEEFIFFVFFGSAGVQKSADNMLIETSSSKVESEVRWTPLNRDGSSWERQKHPETFYPIFIRVSDLAIVGIGEPQGRSGDISHITAPKGQFIAWPKKGTEEARWQIGVGRLQQALNDGYVYVSSIDAKRQTATIRYLTSGAIEKLRAGEYVVSGTRSDGSKIVRHATDPTMQPKSVWNKTSHSARDYGSALIKSFLPDRKFPFPKSLYAVEDTLRFFVQHKPEALVLDFFAGSGTTGHALMRLNRQDGGNRRFILVTNNEVSDDEASEMRDKGLYPGDPEWESRGICSYVTKPRIEAAITGRTPSGIEISGDYKFTDPFPMSGGFSENVEFLELAYLNPNNVFRGEAFEKIAPLLWMKAGSGPVILSQQKDDFALEENCNYAILFNLQHWPQFLEAVRLNKSIQHVFLVTDSRAAYQQVIQELNSDISSTMLYEDYLRNFEIGIGGRA